MIAVGDASMSLVSKASAAPALDRLEFARGALCASTFVAANAAREAHVSKLYRLFDRAGLASSMEDALRTMHFLREAEPLGGGYWAAAPVRTVELGSDCHLLVGPHPTSELMRHFPGLHRVGAGRVMKSLNGAELPSQTQAAWRGSDGNDARAWTQRAIVSAMKALAPSVAADSLQCFAVRQTYDGRREPIWVPAGSGVPCRWRGISFFRARTGATSYRYFLGRREAREEFLEGPVVYDAARVQYGLAALDGQPLTTIITATSSWASISLPLAPPRSVKRVLVALCEEGTRSFGRVWKCCVLDYRQVLLQTLQDLSCETNHHE